MKNIVISSPVLINRENIDTDQIIPARFLKKVDKSGFGDLLFFDWRFFENGLERQTHPFKDRNGEFLLVGSNFGCGSSREHAAWAIKDYGFKAVIGTSFADIFKTNAQNVNLLIIEISQDFFNEICEEIALDTETKLEVDVEKKRVMLRVSGNFERFPLSDFHQNCWLNNWDSLDYLLSLKEQIKLFDYEREKENCSFTG